MLSGAEAEEGSEEGILLSGSGTGNVFLYEYLPEVSISNIMLDFTVDPSAVEGSSLTFSFAGDTEVCSFTVAFTADGYDAAFHAPGGTYESAGMKYADGESGHVQLRLAKDDITDYSTGNITNDWNVVFGIQNSAVTVRNDEYSVRMNRYDGAEFLPLAESLDEYSGPEGVRMRVELSSEEPVSAAVTMIQVSTDCFYDYYVVPISYISLTNLSYTDIAFSFSRPEGDTYECAGFIVERYKNGAPDYVYTYTSSSANSLTDTRLDQNTEYTYSITALRSVSVSNRVACNRIVYKYDDFVVVTQKGNPLVLVFGILAFLGVTAGGVLLYVYWYDIKDKLKRKKTRAV